MGPAEPYTCAAELIGPASAEPLGGEIIQRVSRPDGAVGIIWVYIGVYIKE